MLLIPTPYLKEFLLLIIPLPANKFFKKSPMRKFIADQVLCSILKSINY